MAAALPMCYHGAINKKKAEDLLGKINKDGAYLIRDSETIQGAMCLCVYKQGMVYTYRLFQTHSGHYILMSAADVSEMPFKTLDDLIRHYKMRNKGLVMHLRYSVERKTAMLLRPRKSHTEEPPCEKIHKAPDNSDYVEVLPSYPPTRSHRPLHRP
ncbi:SH2 domain-containing protein 1B [Thalassophryne amazonica]|uniref:SH2 domain-containing protein 1B n=1 Tax=Thalassophryne amazonica TaxID=390379 RepID=UPI00147211D0|nr:SH2 domain-containing protein 1B [Thalassophryne amazonica]